MCDPIEARLILIQTLLARLGIPLSITRRLLDPPGGHLRMVLAMRPESIPCIKPGSLWDTTKHGMATMQVTGLAQTRLIGHHQAVTIRLGLLDRRGTRPKLLTTNSDAL